MNQISTYLKKLSVSIIAMMIISAPKWSMGQTVTQGPMSPTAVSEEFGGCIPCTGSNWQNCSNAATSDNLSAQTTLNQNAICFQNNCFFSRALKVSNYNFNIPNTAIITGIKAEVLRKANAPSSAIDSMVQIMVNASPIGANMSSIDYWTTSFAYEVYGGQTSLWGTTLSPSDINSPGFGLFYKTKNANSGISSVIASVDHVRITVYYQTSTGVSESQVSDNSFSAYYNSSERTIVVKTQNLRSRQFVIRVYNAIGQVVLEKDMTTEYADASTDKINVSTLREGMYFFELRSADKSFSRKIMIGR